MSKFSSRLARYNTINCEQVMPVPVIPICAISCCIPVPICEVVPPPPYTIVKPPPPTPCNPPQSAIDAAPTQTTFQPLKINTYSPFAPVPKPGTILIITSSTVPTGYLLCNGDEVSRTTYSALYEVIGTYYGDGDGATTFNLPSLEIENQAYVAFYIIKT